MEQEIVKVFNEQHEQIGTATRAEVHEKGLWHETLFIFKYVVHRKRIIQGYSILQQQDIF